jgi:pyruvate dehydrogenase E2 component (dihydrolipoyllysine-residue acetyltransferase)
LATDVIMPALGVAQEKGTLLNWLKAEGQSVTKGEPLMEVETDKATVEIEAPASGILTNVTASAGDEIPVGNKIAVILAPGEVVTPAALHQHPLPQGEGTGEGRPVISTPTPPAEPAASTTSDGGRVLASPAAKRIAREKGIDLAMLHGSGPEGSILAEDVLRAAPEETSPQVEPPGAKEVVPLSPMRRIVGQRMTQSKQTAPHFYVSMDIDMTKVSRLRAEWKDRGQNSVPSINDFILHTCARALKDFPSLNSTYTEQQIMMHADINIGTAVALEEGLVVPVIRNADRLSLVELARQSRELIDKAQKKKLFPLDYEGGTFTVSNLGMFGADNFIAIINPPQCAILAVGRVAPRVVAQGDAITIRSLMTATLSADHRVVDGAVAARFLQEVKRLLETPHP